MTPVVSIILVNYNTSEITRQCIRLVREQVKEPEVEIIVVDNASSDNSVETIRQEFTDVQVIESGGNIGFGSANNLGVKAAQGKYLFLLNTDTILQNNPIPYFLRAMQADSELGAVGGYLTNVTGEASLSGGKTYSPKKYLTQAIRAYLRLLGTEHEHPKTSTVDYVIGADMFVRKDVFEQVGGFDERIFMYFEDVELCSRIRALGFHNRLIEGPKIVHLEKQSDRSQFVKIHNMASLMYCIQKEYPQWRFRLFQLTFFLLKLPLMIFKGEKEYVMAAWHWKRYMRY